MWQKEAHSSYLVRLCSVILFGHFKIFCTWPKIFLGRIQSIVTWLAGHCSISIKWVLTLIDLHQEPKPWSVIKFLINIMVINLNVSWPNFFFNFWRCTMVISPLELDVGVYVAHLIIFLDLTIYVEMKNKAI